MAGPLDYMNIKTPTKVGSFSTEVPSGTNGWGNPSYGSAPGQVAYNNYFFSGQDVFVFLYPHYKNKLIPVPVTQFSVGMSQQKIPIYGAWSYHWDAVAKGQVIVQGEFSIVFSKPNMIGQYLGNSDQSDFPKDDKTKAVKPVYNNRSASEVSKRASLRADIWGVSKEGEADEYVSKQQEKSAFPFGHYTDALKKKGLSEANYAGHQPFDIVICFGSNPEMKFQDNSKFDFNTWTHSAMDYIRMSSETPNDVASSGWVNSNRIHLKNVELMSAGHMYEVSGQPLQESYSFIARDMVSPVAK